MNVISLYNEIMNSQRVGGQYDVPTHILAITQRARVLLHIQRLQNVINQIQHLEAVRLRSLRAQLRGLGKKKFRGLVSDATEAGYLILALNTLEELKGDPLTFYRNLASYTRMEGEGVHVSWDILDVNMFNTLDFYAIDPNKRFKSNRETIVRKTYDVLCKIHSLTKTEELEKQVQQPVEDWIKTKLLQFIP